MKKASILFGLLAVMALASCSRKNCPAYGRTSLDNPAAYKGRN